MTDLIEVTLEQVLQPNFVRQSEDTFKVGTILSIKKYDQKPHDSLWHKSDVEIS